MEAFFNALLGFVGFRLSPPSWVPCGYRPGCGQYLAGDRRGRPYPCLWLDLRSRGQLARGVLRDSHGRGARGTQSAPESSRQHYGALIHLGDLVVTLS